MSCFCAGFFTLDLICFLRYHFRYGPNKAYAPGVYSNDDEYFADVAKAYQTELKILYDAGVRNVQVDDPNLACRCSSLPRGLCADRNDRLLLRGHARGMEAGQGEFPDCRRTVRGIHQVLQRLLRGTHLCLSAS